MDTTSAGKRAAGVYPVSAASWFLHWDEVGVFDINSTALGTPPLELMLAAGKHLANIAASGVDGSPDGVEIWLLCGPGNNGGDGYVAAKVLAEGGFNIRILASHTSQKTSLAQAARDNATEPGIPIHIWLGKDWDTQPPSVTGDGATSVGILIDALLGVGPGGAGAASQPRGAVGEVLIWTASHFARGAPKVLACDLPTGFGSNLQLRAGLTVTFHEEKLGMRDSDGNYHLGLGQVVIAPLPFPSGITDVGIGDVMRYPRLNSEARKGDRGRVLVVGGGPYHGAPILAGLAAARMGADLIHVAMPTAALKRVKWPVDLIPEEIPDEEFLTGESVSGLVERMTTGRGVQALVIGPGSGRAEETLRAMRSLLTAAAEHGVPCVIDADAIYSLPRGEWPTGVIGVATPHGVEREGWLGEDDPAEIIAQAAESAQPSKWDLYSESAENAVIITTGVSDEIVGLGGRSSLASGGNPRMAVAGTGDLLAGSIGGLMACGMSPWAASRLACYLLREAGRVAGEQLGPGMVASDLPQYLAGALATALLIRD